MQITIISPDMYTYGAMLIGGVLRAAGHQVTLSKKIEAQGAKTVMLSLFSTQHLLRKDIKEFVKQHRNTGGNCYVGGAVSAYPEIVLGELPELNAVCIGEGEEAVCKLAAEENPLNISGLAFLGEDGKILCTPRAFPGGLSPRPLPLVPKDISKENIRGASVYIETHRGCTGTCTFCQVPRFFGHKIRSRSIEEVVAEVWAFKQKGAKKLSISGGTGSLFQYRDGQINEKAFIELLARMAEIMGRENISCPDIRVDCISEAILQAVRKYTIGWIFFGIESGSDRILQNMGKGINTAQIRKAVDTCRKHGLKVAGSFIVGYPGETQKDFEATLDLVAELSFDDAFISIAEPIPKTPLANLVLKTPKENNPVYMPHSGPYKKLGLSEAEARAFELLMHADMFKPELRMISDEVFASYLEAVRQDGENVKQATELLFKYRHTL